MSSEIGWTSWRIASISAAMAGPDTRIDAQSWFLLVILSVLWGGSFYFAGVAVRELPPLVIVFARVAIAATVLLILHHMLLGPLPADRRSWTGLLGMSILNNVVPFTLIVSGQTMIASGLASVINATTPFFAVIVLAMFGNEPLTVHRVAGLVIGLAGIMVIKGVGILQLGNQTLGILLCLGAAISYGFAGLWAKRRLSGVAPLTSATGQLVCSSLVMLPLAFSFSTPASLLEASAPAWWSVLGLALLSTAVAYIVFFTIIARAGAGTVMLVTMMIPISAIFLGWLLLEEELNGREIAGAIIIGLALIIIDGRVIDLLRKRQHTTRQGR